MAKKFKIDLKKFITEFSGYKHSISFIGNPSEDFCLEILCELIKYYKNKVHIFCDEKTFAKSIEKIKKKELLEESDLKIYLKSHKGAVTEEEERAEVYNSSKINLCINPKIKPKTDIQIFEALVSGGFLITNNRADLMKYFEESRHLEIFSNAVDLIDKIDFYLQNLNIAQKIAQLGRFEIIKNYTIQLRAKKKSIVKYNQNL